jgi:hypothetical protein
VKLARAVIGGFSKIGLALHDEDRGRPLTRWRHGTGEEKLATLIQESIASALARTTQRVRCGSILLQKSAVTDGCRSAIC